MPDFSITTCARSSAGAARGTFARGDTSGVGTAIARGGAGVDSSDGAGDFSEGGVGVFSGSGVSFSFLVAFAFAAFLPPDDALFFCDFFLTFRFGVGVGDFFDFFVAAVGSGPAVAGLDFGFGVASSSSSDSFADFDLGAGDSSGVGDASVSLVAFSVASFAFGIGLGDFLGVGDALRFFFDLLVPALALATGLADFAGVGLSSSSLT
jgi:hypothetical protein